MKLTAIPLDGYYVIVSDEVKPIDFNKWVFQNGNVFKGENKLEAFGSVYEVIALEEKATDKYPGIPLFDAPWKEDVEKLAHESSLYHDYHLSSDKDLIVDYRFGFTNGYNAAKEKYGFTREDMEEAFKAGIEAEKSIWELPKPWAIFEEFIQSLQKPKSYEVEILMEKVIITNFMLKDVTDLVLRHQIRPKLTNNKITITSWKEIN